MAQHEVASPLGETPRQDATPDPSEQALEELPPSARTVYSVLNDTGPMTHKDLLTEMEMPGRTIRYAVKRLKDAGIIGERCNLMDCRQCFFYVQDVCPGQGDARKVRGS